MTTDESVRHLQEVLATIKASGAMRAQVKMGYSDPRDMTLRLHLDLAVEFAPPMPEPPPAGDPIEPGGWKSPRDLDNPFDLNPVSK